MNGLDLFSGIGGLTKSLEGYVWPVAYCESDRYAQAVLLQRIVHGDLAPAPIWDDVRTLRKSMLPNIIDIIYGGFPCQDISLAGRGAGLEGERSGLFFEIIRLVSEIRPSFVFLENVPAITGRGLGTVTGELAALRYDCRWGILSASDVGANHIRERWWLLAHALCLETERKHTGGLLHKSSRSSQDVANTKCQRLFSTTQPRIHLGWWSTEPDVGRVAHGVPFRVDRLRGLGNSVVTAQAREAFERLMGLK